jgi:SAM-dependent methyltransferase
VITQAAAAPLPADIRRAMRAFDEGALDYLGARTVWEVIGQQAATAAGPAPGDIVLDACCGAGASALRLAKMTGPTGRVDAVDLSQQLTRHGALASRRAGLRHVTFRSADVLDWVARRPSGYDAVVCTLGLMFLPGPAHSLAALVGALRPGGRMTVTTWAAGAMRPLIDILWQARLGCGLAPPPPPPFAAGVAATEEPGRLLDLAASAGLDPARVDVHRQKLPLSSSAAWALVSGTVLNSLITELTARQQRYVQCQLDAGLAGRGHLVDATTLTLRARRPCARGGGAGRPHPAAGWRTEVSPLWPCPPP